MGRLLGSPADPAPGLRDRWASGEMVLAPGCYDALAARLVEEAGFSAAYMTGFGSAAARLGLGFVPFFPLASGLLTGKYRRGEPAPAGTRLAAREQAGTDEQFDVVEAVERYAADRGVSMIEVAIGALLARPAVSSVIAGATKPEQVRQNVAAGHWTPGESDLAELEGLLNR